MFEGIRRTLQHREKDKEKIVKSEILSIHSADVLLETERRQQLLKSLPALSQLPPKEYQLLYLKLVQHFAEFAQQLPETKNGYFPYEGGLFDHGLERAVRALAISRSFIVSEGDTKEAVLKQAMLRYALFSVALLYDVGRLVTKVRVTICSAMGEEIKEWHPYEGSMLGQGTHYQYIFEKENWDFLRSMVTPMVARQLMSKAGGLDLFQQKEKTILAKDGFSWIAQDKEILETWFALFKEDMRHPNSILSIIPLADAQTIANYFDLGCPFQELAQPSAGFWEKVNEAISSLADESLRRQIQVEKKFEEEKIFQQMEQEKEVPLTEKPFEPLSAQVAERKMATVPATLAAGIAFFRWLLKSLKNNQLSINSANADIYRVNEGVLLTTDVFKKFAESQSQFKDIQTIQKQFANLGFTLSSMGSNHVFTYNVDRPGVVGTKEGMLMQNPYLVFQEKTLPSVHKSLHLTDEFLKLFAAGKVVQQSITQSVTTIAKTLLPGFGPKSRS